MKSILITLLSLVFTSFAVAQNNTEWKFDNSHTSIQFEISHMLISEVDGEFHDYKGSIKSNGENFENADISFTIKASSIDTDNEKRDKHLRSADFFEVEKYSEIKFVGKEMKKVSDKMYKLIGEITMHGVTKEITLDAKLNGIIDDPYGNRRAGFKVTGSLSRLDFNIGEDTSTKTVGEDVNIICNIEIIKSK